MRYTIEYGSNGQYSNTIQSDSRDAKKHGKQLLGNAGGGYVKVYDKKGKIISYSRYSPDSREGWYNAVI